MPYVVMVRPRGVAGYTEDTTYPDGQGHLARARAQAWRDAGREATVDEEPAAPAPAAAAPVAPRVGELADAAALLARIEADLRDAQAPADPPPAPVQGL